MRILIGLLLFLSGCPEFTVACTDTDRCEPTSADDGGLSTDDLAGRDIATPTACASGTAISLGGGVYACPGVFSASGTTASMRCASGYSLCTAAGTADLTQCGNLPGFFLANAGATVDTQGNNSVTCDVATVSSGNNRIWVGCGGGGTNITMNKRCDGFKSYRECTGSGTISCASSSNSIDGVTNTSANNGVLCCGP